MITDLVGRMFINLPNNNIHANWIPSLQTCLQGQAQQVQTLQQLRMPVSPLLPTLESQCHASVIPCQEGRHRAQAYFWQWPWQERLTCKEVRHFGVQILDQLHGSINKEDCVIVTCSMALAQI